MCLIINVMNKSYLMPQFGKVTRQIMVLNIGSVRCATPLFLCIVYRSCAVFDTSCAVFDTSICRVTLPNSGIREIQCIFAFTDAMFTEIG